MRESIAKTRAARFEEQGGLCYYCKRPMLKDWDRKQKIPPADSCTLEHLINRLSPKRWEENRPDSPRRYAAACARCNHAHSAWCERHTPQELLVRLSKNHEGEVRVSPAEIILEYYRTHEYVEPPPFDPLMAIQVIAR